jgi:hypothetical protein
MIAKTTTIALVAGLILVSGTASFAADTEIAKGPSTPIVGQPAGTADDQKAAPAQEQPKAGDKQPATNGGELQPKAPAK